MVKNVLYVGLNDKETKKQEISTRKAMRIVSNLLLNDFGLYGATLQVSEGIYKHNDGSGKIVKEKNIIIILFDVENLIVNKIIEKLKNALNQESILKETSTVNINFL
jgi:hypothetical protein